MFDISLPTANAIFNAANALLIVGAVVVAVGTIAVFWSGGIRERFADERVTKNEAQTAAANAEAAKANSDAVKAVENTAKVGERAAQLEKDAITARLELEKLRARIQWREITKDQREKLIGLLRGHRLAVSIGYPMGDAEAANFADQISQVLSAAGCSAEASARVWMPKPPVGFGITQTENGDSSFLMGIFGLVGLPMGEAEKSAKLDMVVGTKPLR